MMNSMKNTALFGVGMCALLALGACGGGGGKGPDAPVAASKKPDAEPVVSVEASKKYDAALDAFNAHDKANDWNESTCAEVAKKFETAHDEEKSRQFSEATFNAGLAYQRCGNDEKAKSYFEKAIKEDGKAHSAKAQLALYQYKADSNEDAAISTLQQAVLDAQFQNVPALVNLAMFQMQRDSAQGGDGCKDDMECAKKNLQRALAIDDAYMPAFNQLALYYFQQAKKRAGGTKVSAKGARGRSITTNAAMGKRADVQQLELAALVASQAMKKNAGYAPIHNTAGLIQNELGQVNGAVAEFAAAAKLDPKFFEAQMNYAAVNLSFRGFKQAEDAYRKALDMKGNDYDAHLGLALALRGQITDVNYDKQVASVQSELDTCKKLSPDRPEVYYNEGILTQEYKAKAGGGKDATIAALNTAKGIFQQFIDKAEAKPEYAGAVKRSKERMEDIDGTIQFLNLPGEEQKAAPQTPPPATGAAATPAPAGGAPATPAPAAPEPKK
jgi:tetratricopeptide (TPR) repeat protein